MIEAELWLSPGGTRSSLSSARSRCSLCGKRLVRIRGSARKRFIKTEDLKVGWALWCRPAAASRLPSSARARSSLQGRMCRHHSLQVEEHISTHSEWMEDVESHRRRCAGLCRCVIAGGRRSRDTLQRFSAGPRRATSWLRPHESRCRRHGIPEHGHNLRCKSKSSAAHHWTPEVY